MNLLTGRVAIVTCAGSGIGFGIAETLAGQGAQVIIGELDAARGAQAVEQISARGGRAQAFPLDVTKPESCAAVVERVLSEHKRIDVLVNNAGLFILHKSEEMPEND